MTRTPSARRAGLKLAESRNGYERGNVARPNGGEIPEVHRRDGHDPEPLADSDHRRIRAAEPEIGVLTHEARHPPKVGIGKLHQAHLLAGARIGSDERTEQFQGALGLFLAEPTDEQLQLLPCRHAPSATVSVTTCPSQSHRHLVQRQNSPFSTLAMALACENAAHLGPASACEWPTTSGSTPAFGSIWLPTSSRAATTTDQVCAHEELLSQVVAGVWFEPTHGRARTARVGAATPIVRLSLGCDLWSSCLLPSARFGFCHRNGGLLNVIEDTDNDIDV